MIRMAEALERIADALERDREMHQLIQGMLGQPADYPDAAEMPTPVDWYRSNNSKDLFIRYSDGSALPTTMEEIQKLTAEGRLS